MANQGLLHLNVRERVDRLLEAALRDAIGQSVRWCLTAESGLLGWAASELAHFSCPPHSVSVSANQAEPPPGPCCYCERARGLGKTTQATFHHWRLSTERSSMQRLRVPFFSAQKNKPYLWLTHPDWPPKGCFPLFEEYWDIGCFKVCGPVHTHLMPNPENGGCHVQFHGPRWRRGVLRGASKRRHN